MTIDICQNSQNCAIKKGDFTLRKIYLNKLNLNILLLSPL